ncbi:hypothetical protein [Yoonia vestfoldensis]|uniref:hypothetical protein n=1 Tax=Yoonia vestfoldensis TaxID=245188 RepID=UPI0003A26DE4|nr:hypothetical protein [Yoonia vestfoldensis]
MTHLDPPRPQNRVGMSRRKPPLAAVLVFAIAYIGVLAIAFAPEGRLTAKPGIGVTGL